MPGIVKISDGSNTVGLTVPSSLGSDKTMTIPNVTGTLGTVLISAGSFSSSSFTQGDFTSASYDRYIIKLSSLVPSSDGTSYRFKLMSGASTYMTGSYNEGHYYTKANASGSGTSSNNTVTDYAQVSLNTVGNASTENQTVTLELLNPRSALSKFIKYNCWGNRDNFDCEIKSGFIQRDDATVVTGCEIAPASGTFTSGDWQIYGCVT